MSDRVLVVGAGHAGIQLAEELRRRDRRAITVIDAASEWPYQRPPLSKSLSEAASAPRLLRAQDYYRNKEIGLRLGVTLAKTDLDAGRAWLSDGEVLDFAHLVLATGASPRMVAFEGVGDPPLVLRDLPDARRLLEQAAHARTVAVVGGGYIGLEVAAQMLEMGLAVTVFEAGGRLLSRASEHLAALVQEDFIKRGCLVHLGIRPIIRKEENGRWSVATGAGSVDMEFDLLISGIGVAPRSQTAIDLGLAVNDGVLVDHQLRSSHPRVFAIGDVARFPNPKGSGSHRIESVQNAVDQAAVCAAAICGDSTASYSAVPWTWSDLLNLKVQVAGDLDSASAVLIRGSVESRNCAFIHLRDGVLVGVECVNRPGDFLQFRRLLAEGATPDLQRIVDANLRVAQTVAAS